jgi:hypothetical protein
LRRGVRCAGIAGILSVRDEMDSNIRGSNIPKILGYCFFRM